MIGQPLTWPRRLLAVLVGGFLGTLIRYGLSMLIRAWLGTNWPYDILLINLTGACMLALLATLAECTMLIGPTRRLLLTTGFLGAYTTFSSLALGDVLLLDKGAWLLALVYLILSLVGGLAMIWLGDRLGHLFAARMRPGMEEPAKGQSLWQARAHVDVSGQSQVSERAEKPPRRLP